VGAATDCQGLIATSSSIAATKTSCPHTSSRSAMDWLRPRASWSDSDVSLDDYRNDCGHDAARERGAARHVNVKRWRTVAANCMAGCRRVRKRRKVGQRSPPRRDVGGMNTGDARLSQPADSVCRLGDSAADVSAGAALHISNCRAGSQKIWLQPWSKPLEGSGTPHPPFFKLVERGPDSPPSLSACRINRNALHTN
jgi:hypothetical protein